MDHYTNKLKIDWVEHYLAIFRINYIVLHIQRHCFTCIWIRILLFFLIAVLVKGNFTDFHNCKAQSWWFTFSRTEDLLNIQDLEKRMTECGTITLTHTVWTNKSYRNWSTQFTQASKAFPFLCKTDLPHYNAMTQHLPTWLRYSTVQK